MIFVRVLVFCNTEMMFVRNLLDSIALVIVHPEVKNWIKYARFEEKHGYIAHSRKVYERAVEFFGQEHVDENLFVAFAKFEETQKEVCVKHPSCNKLNDKVLSFVMTL